MFPWFWTWAPQLHLPLSGDVAQRIDPSAWFAAIPPEAGNGHIEQQACAVASYGKQLGLITELLLDVAQQAAPRSAQGQQALRQLQAIRDEIEGLKLSSYTQQADALVQQAQALRARRPELAQRMVAGLQGDGPPVPRRRPRAQ
jgi:hypothetical protein